MSTADKTTKSIGITDDLVQLLNRAKQEKLGTTVLTALREAIDTIKGLGDKNYFIVYEGESVEEAIGMHHGSGIKSIDAAKDEAIINSMSDDEKFQIVNVFGDVVYEGTANGDLEDE